jgi:hypothetical protein
MAFPIKPTYGAMMPIDNPEFSNYQYYYYYNGNKYDGINPKHTILGAFNEIDWGKKIEDELLLPPNTEGFELMRLAIYRLEIQRMRICRHPLITGNLQEYYHDVKDLLFVNYLKSEAEPYSTSHPTLIPMNFPNGIGNINNRLGRAILEYIITNNDYCSPSIYCAIIPLYEKLSIVEKIMFESLSGANQQYESFKLNEVIHHPTRYEGFSTTYPIMQKVTHTQAFVSVNKRKFLFEPEDENV